MILSSMRRQAPRPDFEQNKAAHEQNTLYQGLAHHNRVHRTHTQQDDDSMPSAADLTHPVSPTRRASPLSPQNWQEAEKLAKLLCKTKLVPPGFENPDVCLMALMQGMEIDLPPMTALQRMALVDGRLTLWGDGALAVVLKSGLCIGITEWTGLGDRENEDTQNNVEASRKDITFAPAAHQYEGQWIAFCEVQRLGWPKPVRRSFSVVDAKRASLWMKEGPWTDYPKRMLQMRARAFALRDVFADVLGGLYLREEIEPRSFIKREDEGLSRQVTSKPKQTTQRDSHIAARQET